MTESPKICPICRKPCLSIFSTIFQKGTDGINKVSRLKNDNFTVTPGMIVYVSCRKNYIRTPGVPSSSQEVFTGKEGLHLEGLTPERTFYSGCVITEREKKIKKSCNVSCEKREVDKVVHQGIFYRKDDEWSIEV